MFNELHTHKFKSFNTSGDIFLHPFVFGLYWKTTTGHTVSIKA